ncbi:MAG: addiction module protein [Candidatus Kapaibacterium sp.]
MDITTQYISDDNGNIVSAIIPIEVYKQLLKYIGNSDKNLESLPKWHIQVLKERLENYESGKEELTDLDGLLID